MTIRPRQPHPDYPALTCGKDYAVVGIEADAYRIIDDQGEPALYDAELFNVLDAAIPSHWLDTRGPEGERYAYPAPLNRPGFFEDFFDADPDTVAIFWQTINNRLTTAA